MFIGLFDGQKKYEPSLHSVIGVGYIGIMKRPAIFFLLAMLLSGLLACSTTGGSLLGDAAESDREKRPSKSYTSGQTEDEEEPDILPYESEDLETGLEIRSNPSNAGVYLDNRYMGVTPLILEDVDTGNHKLTLQKEGYYSESQWIRYSGEYQSYYITLEEITGFLKVDTLPPEAEINFGSSWLSAAKVHELAVGVYTIRVRAFGYREQGVAVRIFESRLTQLSVRLEEAPFSVDRLLSNRVRFNPRNGGLLGVARIRFQVSAFGRGQAVITDEGDRVVLTRDLGPFTTWEQGFEWNGLGPDRAPLPDGLYTVRIEASGGGVQDTETLVIRIDSSIVLRFRSLWSGSAGSLYAPSPEILPGGGVQFSSLLLAHLSADGGGTVVRAPVNLGLRAGLGSRNLFELDTSIGGIIGYSEQSFYMPWFASAAFKASLLRTSGVVGFSSAAQAKLTYLNAYTDTLSNFTGFSLGLPTGVQLGPVSLLFSPELILAPWTVSYDSGLTPDRGVYGWAYGRFAVLLDLFPFSAAASMCLRTTSFHTGFQLDLPLQTALEAHWMIPNTQLFLSLAVAAEFESSDSFYVMGGAGLGILN